MSCSYEHCVGGDFAQTIARLRAVTVPAYWGAPGGHSHAIGWVRQPSNRSSTFVGVLWPTHQRTRSSTATGVDRIGHLIGSRQV